MATARVAAPLWVPVIASALGLAPVAAAAAPGVTQAAPAALVGHTLHDGLVDLAKLRGKVVLMFFFSTDCPVCLDKLPELRRNLAAWQGKDFVIVAVSQDRQRGDLLAFEQVLDRIVPANPQMWLVWRHAPGHQDNFGALSPRVPASFIIDRDGRIAKQWHGRVPPQAWDDIAEMVLR